MEKIAHNPNEIIALVDDKDKVIGKITRQEAHSKGLLHREAYVYILNSKKQILLQKRKDNGRWDHSAAGHFQVNENYEEGAIRELYEELGIKVTLNDFKEIAKERIERAFDGIINNRFVKVFLLKRDIPIKKFKVDKEEIDEIKYFDSTEIKELLSEENKTTTACKFLLEKYFLNLIN